MKRERLFAWMASVGLTLGSPATLLSLWALERRCDDSCVAPEVASSWQDTKHAGEWTGQFALSLAGFALLLFSVLLRVLKAEASWMVFAVGVACYASWTVWFLTW